MKHLIEVLILVIPPVIYKLYRDRNGVRHPDAPGVMAVAVVMFICVTLARLHYIWYEGAPFVIVTTETILWWYLKAFLVSITGFGLFFNSLMNWILIRKTVIGLRYKLLYSLEHLSPTAVPDRWFLKFKVGWKLRLAIYLTLFIGSIVWFVL